MQKLAFGLGLLATAFLACALMPGASASVVDSCVGPFVDTVVSSAAINHLGQPAADSAAATTWVPIVYSPCLSSIVTSGGCTTTYALREAGASATYGLNQAGYTLAYPGDALGNGVFHATDDYQVRSSGNAGTYEGATSGNTFAWVNCVV
jgi:hypothetical protein